MHKRKMTRPTMTDALQLRFKHPRKKEKSHGKRDKSPAKRDKPPMKRDKTPVGRGLAKIVEKKSTNRERVFSFDDRAKKNEVTKKNSKTPIFTSNKRKITQIPFSGRNLSKR